METANFRCTEWKMRENRDNEEKQTATARWLVFFELYIIWGIHLNCSLPDVCPVGAENCTAWLHLKKDGTQRENSLQRDKTSLHLLNTFSNRGIQQQKAMFNTHQTTELKSGFSRHRLKMCLYKPTRSYWQWRTFCFFISTYMLPCAAATQQRSQLWILLVCCTHKRLVHCSLDLVWAVWVDLLEEFV